MNRAEEWSATYGNLGQVPQSQLCMLPLNILDPWRSADGQRQPFKMYTPEKLEELADSVRSNGIIEPICVRPKPGSRMEIIAGHNRVEAAKLAGLRTVPAIVQQLDDIQAAIMLVDSNLKHRETLLPSEKAFAYKLRLESLKRQGQRTNSTSGQIVPKLERSRDEVDPDTSGRQIQRYIRLTYLIQPLLNLVDEGKPGFAAAVDLSFLTVEEQTMLLHVMEETGKIPNGAQAKLLRKAAGQLTEEAIRDVLVPAPAAKPVVLKIAPELLAGFFPTGATAEEMERIILAALAAYRKKEE